MQGVDLPPGCLGRASHLVIFLLYLTSRLAHCGSMYLTVACVAFDLRPSPIVAAVRIKWWGEEGNGVLLRYRFVFCVSCPHDS